MQLLPTFLKPPRVKIPVGRPGVFSQAARFHHSNLRLPVAWERRLNRVFVIPRRHGVHHSAVGPETNSIFMT